MLKKLLKENMGKSNLGWLESRFHFSFAQYRNPDNINFGVLRVLNDDIIHANGGFDTHPHADMEIITYIIDGELTHKDSMGNEETLTRGEVQYMSAGDGIFHSEHNRNKTKDLRVIQIWILPPENSLPRLYGSFRFKKEQRENNLLKIISSENGDAPIKIHQDVNFYVCELDKTHNMKYDIKTNRQVYFVQVEGSSNINGIELNHGDAMEITKEFMINIEAISDSHFLFIEMKEQ
jgi:quercetin 2,3-dioxygenase